MSRIAEAVGISGPALYKHFAGRTEILEAALDLLQQRVKSWLDSSDHPDAIERLRQLGTRHVSTVVTDYEGVVAPLFEFVAASPRSHLKEQMGRRRERRSRGSLTSSRTANARAPSARTSTRSSSHGV